MSSDLEANIPLDETRLEEIRKGTHGVLSYRYEGPQSYGTVLESI